MKISVIIPVLHEEKYLQKYLSALPITECEEVIVVDGGSLDRTTDIASEFTDKVFVTDRGRGHQMNYGAEKAEGDILLFLHADCILPDNAFKSVRSVMRDAGVSVGAFDLSIDNPSFKFRIVEMGANLRSRVTSIPYGDQGMFMRKSVFERIGGFADIPLMEDIEISKRLKKAGKVVFIRPPVRSSARRWLKEGLIYTTLRDWSLAVSYSFGRVSPEKLMRYYRDVR